MMTERTIVHLVRHGEVNNPDGILYERLPGFYLTSLGRQMAEGMATALAKRDIVQIRVSPLERAQETAAPLGQALNLQAVVDQRVIESGNVFAGQRMRAAGGALRNPRNWRHLMNPLRPSWGEPYATIATRMMAAVYAARDVASGHEAVIVSHQLPIWITRLHVENKRLAHSPRSRICTLCSVTSVHFLDDRVERVSYFEPVRDLIPSGAARDPFSAGSEERGTP
jgi:broad specificity phosphatase PhoE